MLTRSRQLSLLTLALLTTTMTACTREPDPALDLYIMPLYIAGMIPFAVSVGVRDIYAANRASRIFNAVLAVVYLAVAIGVTTIGWWRSGIFILLVAIASAVLAARPGRSGKTGAPPAAV